MLIDPGGRCNVVIKKTKKVDMAYIVFDNGLAMLKKEVGQRQGQGQGRKRCWWMGGQSV
jgi:hypothetical protein